MNQKGRIINVEAVRQKGERTGKGHIAANIMAFLRLPTRRQHVHSRPYVGVR